MPDPATSGIALVADPYLAQDFVHEIIAHDVLCEAHPLEDHHVFSMGENKRTRLAACIQGLVDRKGVSADELLLCLCAHG